MKESSKRQGVFVGLFVVIAMGILIAGILAIGDLSDMFARKVAVSVVFDDVGGLKAGDNVWFSGVKVGTVKELGFRDDSKVEVDLKLDRDMVPFLPEDSKAKIGADGLIGNRLVVIYGGTAGRSALAEGAVLPSGESVSSDDIMAVLQENNKNVKVITDKLANGEGSLGKLLADDALYNDVRGAVTSLQATSDSAHDASTSIATFAAKLDRPGTLAHEAITDRTTWKAVQNTVDNLQRTGDRAQTIAARVDAGTQDPNTPVGTLLHDRQAGEDLKETLVNLKESSAALTEDLTAAQSNFLLRKYFKKKEKAEKAKAKADKEAAHEHKVDEVASDVDKSE